MYGKPKKTPMMQIVSYYRSCNRYRVEPLDVTEEIDSDVDGNENDIECDEQVDVLRSFSSKQNSIRN